MIIYILIFVLWGVFSAPLDIARTFEKKKENYEKIQEISRPLTRSLKLVRFFWGFLLDLLFDSILFDLIMNLSFAILGVAVSRIFFSFMLLDIIGRSDLLTNVIRAIT